LLLHTLADFSDFRGLALALAAFDPTSPVADDEQPWSLP